MFTSFSEAAWAFFVLGDSTFFSRSDMLVSIVASGVLLYLRDYFSHTSTRVTSATTCAAILHGRQYRTNLETLMQHSFWEPLPSQQWWRLCHIDPLHHRLLGPACSSHHPGRRHQCSHLNIHMFWPHWFQHTFHSHCKDPGHTAELPSSWSHCHLPGSFSPPLGVLYEETMCFEDF